MKDFEDVFDDYIKPYDRYRLVVESGFDFRMKIYRLPSLWLVHYSGV